MIVPGSVNPLLAALRGDPIDELGVIARSLRFRSTVSAYLSRTPASASNRKTWTWNGWVKRQKFASNMSLFCTNNVGNQAYSNFTFDTNDKIYYLEGTTVPSNPHLATSSAQYRDSADFMNVHAMFDSTRATASQRFRVFVGGLEIVMNNSATMPQNYDGNINTTQAHWLCANIFGGGAYLECNLSNVAFVDGQALLPTSFGAFHSKTGQFRPRSKSSIKAVVDAGGINSYFLPFDDPTSLATLCADASSKGNNWTANNISLSAGSTYDSSLDTPTTGWCVLNALANGSTTLAGGALEITGTTTGAIHGTLLVPRDYPVYFEVENVSTNNSNLAIGAGVVRTNVMPSANYQISGTAGINGWYSSNGPYAMKDNGTSQVLTTATAQAGDVIQVAINGNNGWIGKSDVWFDSAGGTTGNPATGANPTFTLSSAFDYVPYVHVYANTARANFGQRAWSKTCPAGFKAINKKNRSFPAFPRPKEHFDALAYAGDGNATQAVTGLLFPPDFLNIKSRAGTSGAAGWGVFDRIRGATKRLRYDSAAAETTEGLASLDTLGFTLNKTGGLSNEASTTYVAHAWKLGGAPIANNAGTIASQVSANVLAGVSAVAYTGTGAAATVGHGLGAVPKMILVKNTNNVGGSSAGFCMGHASLNAGVNPWNYFLQTRTTAGAQAAATPWNNTAPDNAKFSVANDLGTNYNGASYIAYCFAEVPGFSKFGDFQGNGSADGTFVNCGFAPRYVLVKDTLGTSWWFEWDSARETYNVMGKVLNFNTTNAETAGTAYNIDFVSNGFKFRWGGGDPNQASRTYVFAAFAEFPGRYANAR